MRKIIHNIRKQPEEIRRHILYIITVAFAVLLALLWIYSLGTGLTNTATEAKISEDLNPFSALKNNIIDGYNSITGPGSGTEE